MIRNKNELRFYIMSDRIIAGLTPKPSLKEILRNRLLAFCGVNQISTFLTAMRKYDYYKDHPSIINKLKKSYYALKFSRLSQKLGFSIPSHVFGYGLRIPHYGSIVVNGGVKAGNLCALLPNICVAGDSKEFGDALFLATGSEIVGQLTLGDNVTIAAHSLVNKSFGSNVLLAGSPAVIKRDENFPWYELDDFHSKRVKKILQLKQEMNL